ncbi:MAG: family 20 glycosylhydrolase [Anaerolineae bacterium]|nr:family 20 glycosylhydrolase [Anaerolineae bacterium]
MTPGTPVLLPIPRQLHLTNEQFDITAQGLIWIDSPSLLFEAKRLQRALNQFADAEWEIGCGGQSGTVIRLATTPSLNKAEHYRLNISPSGVSIEGSDAAGVYYGVCTLNQLIQQYGRTLPGIQIEDWPDFRARGVMLDISRDKVPTLTIVMELIDRLSTWKINQLQLYMEHTFTYRKHPVVWAEASPFTSQDILELDRYCRERHVELVPNQNSLGHMERWLKHPAYHDLSESPDGFELPWGGFSPPTTLNPIDPRSLELVFSLYDDLLPHFTSRNFNVGGDEPWELGQGKSKSVVDERGGRVYLDYLLKLHQAVTERGFRTQFWADIILHYPDLIPELPKDLTAMLWGYEGGEDAEASWEANCAIVARSGIPFYVCPGTSSWNALSGRTDNAIDNCRITAVHGIRSGAVGYLNTDWGDRGHWQPLPVSDLGFACGAAFSWCYQSNQSIWLPDALNLFAYEDHAGVMGKLVYELGNIYRHIGPLHINGQVLATSLQQTADQVLEYYRDNFVQADSQPDLRPATLRRVLGMIDSAMGDFDRSNMQRPDATLIRAEYGQVCNLLRHSIYRLLGLAGDPEKSSAELHADLMGLLQIQRENWLARNRPGGLEDSIQRFNHLFAEYR